MSALSHWWREGRRILVAGSFGQVRLVVSEYGAVGLDDGIADAADRLFQRGQGHANDLQYVMLRKLSGEAGGQSGLELEIKLLQTVDRALVEAFDLHQSDFHIRADKPLHRDFEFGPHLLDQCCRELIEVAPGVVLIHCVVPFERRVILRARADARARMVDDLVALRAPSEPEAA